MAGEDPWRHPANAAGRRRAAADGSSPALVRPALTSSYRLAPYSDVVPYGQVNSGRLLAIAAALAAATTLTSCAGAPGPRSEPRHVADRSQSAPARLASPKTTGHPGAGAAPGVPLPRPAVLTPFGSGRPARQGVWRAAGRPVHGVRAVYETRLVPPGGRQAAGIAWMDARLLSARLYSGSLSPGGGPYRFTAPVAPAQARTLVAAFNGGFKMKAAHGGYYTEGRTIDALRRGAASLVIYANGNVAIGAWGSDGLVMSPALASVRQNLVMLVSDGQPTHAAGGGCRSWGNTCGATSCAASVPGIKHQWRSGVGTTPDGALVYVVGPRLDPPQLARLLVRAGAVEGMQLDINPFWPTFAAYDPASPHAAAAPHNGTKLLAGTAQGPATFFDPSWARDFITMSARPAR